MVMGPESQGLVAFQVIGPEIHPQTYELGFLGTSDTNSGLSFTPSPQTSGTHSSSGQESRPPAQILSQDAGQALLTATADEKWVPCLYQLETWNVRRITGAPILSGMGDFR